MSSLDAFRALSLPTGEGSFRLGDPVCAGCRLAVSHEGHLALLIDVVRTEASNPRHFENLRYEPPRELEVIGRGGRRRQPLAALVCRTKDEGLQSAFLRIAVALLDTSAAKLTEGELETRLDENVNLFRALGRPASQTIQGLWCELAVVLWSADVRLALASWHSSPRALHDFVAGPARLEVKSCGTGMREHALRLEQLQEAPGGRTLLASLVVGESDDGETVGDLCDAVLARVDHDIELKRRLETIVTQSLGRDWREAASRRFALEEARRELRIYDARQVPTVPQPLPAEVKHVHFVVDLSTTTAMSFGTARELGGFFEGILPGDE
ncbi:MAG: PD-(D/E)XK motif protein [Myxococcales bacterium]|nr:PD-(D/E)XK motif protein [Myxococcales bacterium]